MITKEIIVEQITDLLSQLAKAEYLKGYTDGVDYVEEHKPVNATNNYECGLTDAWECARKILHLNQGELSVVFPKDGEKGDYDDWTTDWIYDYSASEAISKVKEYEKKQLIKDFKTCMTNESAWRAKFADEIKIGDEVQSNYEGGNKYVITSLNCINNSSCYACLGGKKVLKSEVHKTGRHFPQIAEVFAQMED